MRNLTPFEMDALNELFNIGLHRAAASLSALTAQRVQVDLPRLWVCPVDDLQQRLEGLVHGELATVHQVFHGEVAGDAVFMLEYEKAALLSSMMTDGDVAGAGIIDQSAREVLAEVGNIVLGACLSAFGNVMNVMISFDLPRIQVESLDGLLRSIVNDEWTDTQYALLAATRFSLADRDVGGYLVVVLGIGSIARASAALQERL